MSVREALAAAANTVTGVNVTPYYRQTAKPGEGYVRLDRTDYPNRLGGVCTWQVLVICPQGLAAAEQWIDAHSRDLRDALLDELDVTSVTPIQLITDTGTAVPVVAIEGTRTEEE